MGFLDVIMGPLGAKTMGSLIKSSPGMRSNVIGRCILGWLRSIPEGAFVIPTIVSDIRKANDTFTGSADVLGHMIEFEDIGIPSMAAIISVGLGINLNKAEFSDVDISRLGTTIDLLIKANQSRVAHQPVAMDAPESPVAPQAPVPPGADAPKTKKTRLPRVGQSKQVSAESPTFKMSEIEATQACPHCGGKLMRSEEFVGCWCLKDLAKSVITERTDSGYSLILNGWDDSNIQLLEDIYDRSH